VVELRLGDRPVAVGAVKQRAVLAMLALQANAPVSSDELTEGLWGERAPPTAAKTLQVYVSRLRKALEGGDAEILTRGRGYELRIGPDAVDAVRFERVVEEASRTGRADHVRAALDLWSAAPLHDVADEPFASAQIRRLQQLRLRARELAIDGSLQAGEHLAVLAEIEALVAEEPLREHPRGQQMLALYRTGRQADALAAYRELRRRLVDDLGIEPGPEIRALHDAILRQDPALALAPAPAAEPPGESRTPERRTMPRRAVAAAVVLLGLVGALVVLLVGRSDPPAPAAVAPDSVAIIDPASDSIAGGVELPAAPGPIAAASGVVWVLSPGSSTVTRIDARTRKVLETAAHGGEPPAGNLAVVPGNAWIADGCQDGSQGGLIRLVTTHRPFSIPEEGVYLPLEAPAGTPAGRATPPTLQTGPGCGLAARGRSVWSASYVPPGLARVDVDPEGDFPYVARVVPQPFITTAIAVGAGSLWVRDTRRSSVWRVDPRTLAREREIQTGSDPAAIAVGAGAVWVANSGDGSVSRIDPRTNTVTKAISVGDAPVAIAAEADAVWVANSGDGTVSRIDPRTNAVAASIRVGHRPRGIALSDGAVWVTVEGRREPTGASAGGEQ
jgi:YVTN family beta-propeller protein